MSVYDESSIILFFTHKLRDYYAKHFVSCVVDISKREFGIGTFHSKISSRHLCFGNLNDFNNYLRTTTPFYISYSVSYFKKPESRPMSSKVWEASDIVYEFDADDYDLACNHEHTVWSCENCKQQGFGILDVCPECSCSTTLKQWTCDVCLNKAKQDMLKLIDFLENEFKLDASTFIISFSGAKGYHVRITDPKILNLSKSARIQMMNYILGNDLELSKLGFFQENNYWRLPSFKHSFGWAKKILNYIEYIFLNFSEQDYINEFGLSARRAKLIFSLKEDILNKMYHNNILSANFSANQKFFKQLLDYAIDKLKLKIDPQSSSDIYKIMRVPDTIHGGTGFLSSFIKDKEALKKFDAFKDPVVLGGCSLRKIKILQLTPRFRLIDNFYGSFKKDQVLELPENVCFFLILKGVATFE